ncbi:MAG: tetratricopeptide repeat protein [Bacteroidales bacterium]|nr:tetratricopeptide repeat protein [Bacteroidales bacterium]
MRTLALTLVSIVLTAFLANAQTEKKSIRQGNREFSKNDFTSSEISYRKAIEKNPSSFKANFNLADALYKQDKQEETVKLLDGLSGANVNDVQKSGVYYNMGNSYLKQKKLKESIDSYKKSLRLNPNDNEAKYNLAEAQRMLKQQQQKDKNDKNKDNKDNKDSKDKNKDQDKKDQKDKDNKDKNKQNQDQKDKNQPQPQKQKISQEDARRMLEALQNNEKQVQQKLREQQVKASKVKVDKNW